MRTQVADTWKQFDRNVVTHSAAHHIVAIAELLRSHGYARVSDVAKVLNITRGSTSLTLKTLRQKEFVVEDENRFLRLSKKGELVAQAVLGKKALLQRFLCDVLGVPAEDAEVDVCKIEHLVGPVTAQRLAQFLHFVESNDAAVRTFVDTWRAFHAPCDPDPGQRPASEADEQPHGQRSRPGRQTSKARRRASREREK